MFRNRRDFSIGQRIKLPEPVADIYRAVVRLEELYPGRKFTPDGHLVGSIGEVIAAGSARSHPLPSLLCRP